MRKSALKSILAVALVLCFMLPMLAPLTVAVSAAEAASATYPEGDGWFNTNAKAPTDYAYSIAVVGDTQSIVKKDLTNGTNYISNIYSWLAANADTKNIQYVLGVGDITEYTENFDSSFDGSWTYDDEWTHAKNAITLLDGKIPYSLCRGGGHDTVKKFNEYFASHGYYTENVDGTYAAGDFTSSYSTFDVGDVKYMIVTLDWNPSDAILAWADGIIAANPDRRVILTTHAYLAKDGTLIGSSSSHSAVPTVNNGVDIWEKLVKKYDNIQLVLSGHDPSANLVYRQDTRESGSVVTALLVDPQTFDSQNNAETGMVCMLYFSEDGNTVSTEWYSTVRDQYYKTSNQFTLKLNELPSEDGSIVTKYGVIPAAYTDPDSYPFVCFLNGEFKDFGTCDLFNYASGTLERALRKLTANDEVVIVARKNIDVIDGSNGYLVTNYMPCKVTIDLMGYTLNANTASPTNTFSAAATQTFNTNLTVKNGAVIVGKGLLSVSTGGGDKVQCFTFEDLNIVSYYKELLTFNQYKTAGDVNISFINCDITAANAYALSNVFRAGNSGDTKSLINAKVTVMGGSVSYLASDFSKFVQEYNGSTVSFLPDESGELTKITVPTGASVGSKEYKGENGATLSLIKNRVTESGDEYAFIATNGGAIETPYGTIPSEYASIADYPFIAFVNGEVIASDNIFIDKSGSFERALRNKNTGDGVVIILRRDFTLPELGFFYTNYQKGTVVIDLMGHTVTNPYAENLFSSNGTQTVDNNLVVKNGTLVLAKSLLSVSTHKNAPGKTQSFVFENLNITTTYNHLAFHNTSACPGKVNISYIDCNITASNANINIFTAGKSATDTNFVTDITVKGGAITISKFTEVRLAPAYNGGSVTFLPNEDGNYFSVILPTNAAAPSGSYNNGDLSFVKISEKSGSVVYALAEAVSCEHEYDNACDAICNLCGEERAVEGHVYDNAFDADCNNCGEIREVEIITSGEVSRKIFWAFEDGVLTITGRGKIKNFSAGVTPWSHLADQITKVVIGEGLTYIGSSAFYCCANIESVELPETLTAMGNYVFYGCSALKSIEIPEAVTEIGKYSFRRSGLETIDFAIGYGWSAGDREFTIADIISGGHRFISKSYYKQTWVRNTEAAEEALDSNYVAGGIMHTDVIWELTYTDESKTNMKLTIRGNGAMADFGTAGAPWYAYWEQITEIEIQDGVTTVGRCAFYGLKFVRKVTVSTTVTSIGEYGFYMCRLLKSIELPEDVTIGTDAFVKTGVTV